jgi:hypothetical protein
MYNTDSSFTCKRFLLLASLSIYRVQSGSCDVRRMLNIVLCLVVCKILWIYVILPTLLWSRSPAVSAFRSVSSALIMQATRNSKILVPSCQTTRNHNQTRQSCPSPHHEGIWGSRRITLSKGQFYGPSIAGIADSNPAESIGVRLLCLLCVMWVVASVKC